MIKTQEIEINGRKLIRTYSDTGYMIENQQGVKYSEAVDPENSGRTYTETDEKIPEMEIDAQEALDIITGVK